MNYKRKNPYIRLEDKIKNALDNKIEKDLIDILKTYDTCYYNNRLLIPDSEYDKFREKVFKLFSNNKYFKSVGASIIYGKKIKHDIPMLSLDRSKTIEGIKKWLNKINYNETIVSELKLDGVSGSIIYENGKIQFIKTRGDGKIGEDLTHIKDYINTPKHLTINNKIEVRGEFVIKRNSSYGNEKLRNICNGILHRKENLEELSNVDFIAYQLYGIDFNNEDEELKELIQLGFNVEIYWISSLLNLEKIYNEYLIKRINFNYDSDGLVLIVNDKNKHKEIDSKYVVNHHHHYNIALKPPSKSEITKLLDITWQMSRFGNLTPVALLEPIKIDGILIQKASLHNYKNVIDMNLFYGDKLEIERSNDVIPYIYKKISSNKENYINIPKDCPYCSFKLFNEGVNLVCKNKDCPEIILQKIIHWFKDLDGVSVNTLRLMYEKELFHDIKDIYILGETFYKINIDLNEIPGLGDKKIQNFIKEVNKLNSMTLHEFILRLGIYQVGKRALKKLNINTLDDFWNFSNNTYVIGQNLIKFREENKFFIEELIKILKIKKINNIINTNKLNICITGKWIKGRKELIKDIENMGHNFIKDISKEVNILICENIDDNSEKLKKAKKYGIELITYEKFFN